MINEDKNKRYNRNIIIDNIGETGQAKLLKSKVLIAGAGGLGSSVITALASVGIGTLGIIDNDTVEISNLNRQFIHKFENIGKIKVNSAKEWVNSYNPDIEVKIYQTRLNEENSDDVLKDYDIVADCFDSYESKFMLNKACIKNGKTLIHAGVAEFCGQVMTIIPEKSACLSCLFPENNNPYVIKGVISPTVNTIGSIQAMEIVKALLGFDDLLINSILSYDGISQTFRKITIKQNNSCLVCRQSNKKLNLETLESR